jgi:hypothetical protein
MKGANEKAGERRGGEKERERRRAVKGRGRGGEKWGEKRRND